MNCIVVRITMHFDPAQGNFEELRQKEMAHVMRWKETGMLDSFFIKTAKDGAMIVFKDTDLDEVVKQVEALPFFPYMQEVNYEVFDKIF